MVYVQQLSQLDKGQVDRVGGKNANLGEMIRSGIRVPPGFAVTVDGYRRFVEHTGIGEEIERVLAAVDVQDADGLDQKCGEIRAVSYTHLTLPTILRV